MDQDIVQAGVSFEAVFWIVLVFIWMIVQVVSKLVKGASAPPPRPSQPPRPTRQPPSGQGQTSIEDEMQAFLASLTGAQPRPQPPPQPPPVQPKVQQASRQPQTLAGKAPRRTPEATPRRPRRAVTTVMDMPEAPSSRQWAAVTQQKLTLARLPGMKMPGTPLPSSVSGFSSGGPRVTLNWQDPNELRRSMVSHFILGPPVAMQSNPEPVGRWHY